MMSAREKNGFSSGANWEASQASCVVFGQSACTTSAAVALLSALTGSGLRAVGMMPVSTGDGPNGSALQALAAAGAFTLPLTAICPYVFEEEGAAAALAQQRGITLGLETMVDTFQALATWSDGVVVAAPGDVRRPLGKTFCLCDLARELALPAVLVVDGEGHGPLAACATANALRERSIPLAGWVAVTGSHAGEPDLNECVTRNLAASLLGTLVPCQASEHIGCLLAEAGTDVGYQARFDLAAVLKALRGPWL